MTLPACRFIRHTLLALLAMMGSLKVEADVPQLLNHQGLIAVNGVGFEGNGLFKFALVNAVGFSTTGSEPGNAVTLVVTKGLYAVLLGDASLTHMSAIPAS
jgi:microcystin-dependent protein